MSQSQYYVTHYFNAQNAGSFMAVSLIGLIVVLAIVLLTAKLQKHYKINIENPTEAELAQIEQTHKTKVISWIESFYEMVFSSTSVLIFVSLYYVILVRPDLCSSENDLIRTKSLRTTDLCLLYHSDLVVHKIYL